MKHSIIPINWFGTPVTSTTTLTGIVQTAYSKFVEFAFQPQLYFSQFARQKTWDINERDPMPGDVVTFTIFNSLAAATGQLPETTSPSAVVMGKTQKSVTLNEYGALVTTSAKLRTLSFTDVDSALGTVVGQNMGLSIDLIARAAFDAHTGAGYVKYASGTALTDITATNIITAADIRYARNRLARNNVIKNDNQHYVAVLHPDVIYDLRAETGSGAWRAPKEYVDPSEIYNGEIGLFEGFRFVETTNAQLQADAGTGAVDVYTSYFFGFQAVAYANGIAPRMQMSGPFDEFQRLTHVVWYALIGFGELRRESLYKIYTASSAGENV